MQKNCYGNATTKTITTTWATRPRVRPTTAWTTSETTTRATCTSPEHERRARTLVHLFILSHVTLAQDLSLIICHPRSCAFLLESLLLFYFHLSFPVFSFSFHLLHCELYSELDNLIAMESLCYSANKGSDDAYDVSTSLTGYEPNFVTFGELNDSSVPFSFMIPSTDQDVDDVTLGEMLAAAHRGQLRTRRRVSQSVSRRL